MNKEQLFILTILFCLTLGSYILLKKGFKIKNTFILINLLLIIAGIAGAILITPYLYPYIFIRNLPVFLIIPLCAYNFYYLTDFVLQKFNTGKILQEVIGFFSILIGTMIGGIIVNIIGTIFFKTYFRVSDVQDVLQIVLMINTVRLLINYAGTVTTLVKKQAEIKELKIKKEKTELQLEALQLKINPHFLYNSLNSIAALSTIDGEKTRDMTIGLAKLLRYSLMYQRNSFATLEEECEIVKEYIEIEKIRLGDDLQYKMNIADETKKILVPRFILQPIVENSIKHGTINGKIGITVSTELKNNELRISVKDTGKSFPEKINAGIGLSVVSEKLALLFPDKYEIQTKNEPEKEFVILIKDTASTK